MSAEGRRCVWVVGLVAAIALPVRVPGAPITFNTALPVAKDELIFRGLFVVSQSGDDPSAAGLGLSGWTAVSVLGYGATPRLALFGVLPYVDMGLDSTVAGETLDRSAGGLGDLSLFGRYTVYQRDRPGRTLRLAPFAGLKAPTGAHDERDASGQLPHPVQPGSGSWDGFGGIVGSYQTLRYQVDAQILYRPNTEANDFEAGDLLSFDASLQYRLWPWRLKAGVPAFLYGILEANLVHRDKDRVAGRDDANSGGTQLFLTPGLQYVTRRWVLEAAVQLPVLQELNGAALETDYVVHAGFRFAF